MSRGTSQPKDRPVLMFARCLTAVLALSLSGLDSAAGQERETLRPRVDMNRLPPTLPPHAEPFEFTLPLPAEDRTAPAELIAGLRDPGARGACLAGLVRLELDTLRRHAGELPAEELKRALTDPAAGKDAADACGLLFGLTDEKTAATALSAAVLERAKRGDDATGCVLGLLLCGGEPALAWLEKLCLRPRCPAGFTHSVLTAADVAVRERAVGLQPDRVHGFAEALLGSDAAAELAVDRLTDWRAWSRCRAVLGAAANSTDPDENRRRSLQLAAARFAMACVDDPASGADGRLCRGWLAETSRVDPDLIRRAKRIAGR